jgi:hypothetical protein
MTGYGLNIKLFLILQSGAEPKHKIKGLKYCDLYGILRINLKGAGWKNNFLAGAPASPLSPPLPIVRGEV